MDSSISDISSEYDGSINTLLVTANVGSLFEDPQRLLDPWLLAFLHKIGQLGPKFLGLHLQEVGGKTYEKSMECVQEFIKKLCNAPEMQGYEIIRIFLDEDFKSAEHFTALGNIYFIHKHLKNVRLWNFLTRTWDNAVGKDIYSGNIETIPSKEKSKFPQHFFPECKWSRKGFMRTRWDVNHTVFDLVNIHLFHDASNLAACEEFPSVYCKTRRRALVHTLERFHLDEKNGLVPFFVFGDFNFRCDVEGVVKELTKNLTAHRVQSTKSDNTKVHYRNSTGDNILTVGKKEFNHADHQLKFKEPWLKKFDRELEPLHDFLHEFVIEFPPTYPYEEDPEMPTDYMSTRCPSWCDRILMTPQAKHILDEKLSPNTYNIIGEDVCMGDHKPVYLHICIKPNQGTYRCCNCHYLKANHSPTHNISASTIIKTDAYSATPDYCPHKNIVFNEPISEFNQLNNGLIGSCTKIAVHSTTSAAVMPSASNEIGSDVVHENEKHTAPFGLPYDDEKDNEKANQKIPLWPPISINIIDTDSIPVCMCSQIPNTIIDVVNEKSIESSICTRCQNIIMMQSTEPRYCVISKRLVLSNNIIVNRIDTQHLSTYFDFSYKHQDPYTPESAESHSPCPDLNTFTSTSSDGCSSDADCRQLLENQKLNVVSYGKNDGGERSIAQGTVNIICDESDKLRRGFVSPHQLKTRLEDLRLSCNQNTKYIDGGVAGDSDVEDIGAICPSNTVPIDQYSNSAENYVAKIPPEKLQMIINETVGNDVIWREQCQAEVSALSTFSCKTRYVQIHSLTSNDDSTHSGKLDVENADISNLNAERDVLQEILQPLSVLKETTV